MIIFPSTPPFRKRRRSYKQHYSCSYKDARLAYLMSIIHHASMIFSTPHLGQMSIKTNATSCFHLTSSADEARRNHCQVPTRPGHHSIHMSQAYRIGHIVAGHRRGDSNAHISASNELRVLHDWAPTRRKSSLSSTYPVGHTNMAIVHVIGYRRNKATHTIYS